MFFYTKSKFNGLEARFFIFTYIKFMVNRKNPVKHDIRIENFQK